MRNKIVLNSPRFIELKKKQHKAIRRKILFITIFFIFVLVGLSFLSKWQALNISDIKITGNKVIETKTIEDIVQGKISGNYLYFLPKTNFLFYPKKEIVEELTAKFKRIKDISINVSNLKTLNISLTERTALYTYCGVAPAELDEKDQKCYFMDEDGFIFDEAPYFSGEVYTKFYGNTGPYFFKPNFTKLVSLKDSFKSIGVKPVVFFVEDNGDIEVFLSSTTTQLGPFIIFKADADFTKIAENLQTVITTEPLQTEFKNKYSSLLYIDLRFGNKVYYKFR